jgi:hypothetical protein
MINDDIPSSAPGQPSSSSGPDGNANGAPQRHDGDASEISSAERDRLRKAGLVKKLQFMTHLMRSLDMVVFAEICAMYYME